VCGGGRIGPRCTPCAATASSRRIEGLTAQRDDEPGVSVSVIRGADVVVRHVGLASLTHRVPIGPRTRFHIVSVSKTFMAAAVLVLAARGALRLDDDVRRHLPELPQSCHRLARSPSAISSR
jgi:CubicO group peptidase (beta-lactamase class C family)